MLYAAGLAEAAIDTRPVAIVKFEGSPCDVHLLELAQETKNGTFDSRLIGWQVNTTVA